MKSRKLSIYQILPRLFHDKKESGKTDATIEEKGCGKLSDLNPQRLHQIRSLGITHIWLTGLIRHASGTSYDELGIHASPPAIMKGRAGSPYAIRDYYDLSPDLADQPEHRFEEFKDLVSRLEDAKLGLFIDFVPNHVSRDYCSLQKPDSKEELGQNDDHEVFFHPNNNFYYFPGESLLLPQQGKKEVDSFIENPAKATGNDVFHAQPSSNDWYETVKLNYGVDPNTGKKHFEPIPDTWKKMLDILLFWSGQGISGFRCDMAGMVPPEFWKFAIMRVKETYPDLKFIAEIYEPEAYVTYLSAGFDYLYDKVGLYDITRDLIEGRGSTQQISQLWQNLNGIDNQMLRFLENHDEQRIASKYFAGDPEKGIGGFALTSLLNQGPILLYFGQELGEPAHGAQGFSQDDGRTSIFDYSSIPTIADWLKGESSEEQNQLRAAYQKILLLASGNPVIQFGDFYDLMWLNEDLEAEIRTKVFAFLRHFQGTVYLIAVNFCPDLSEIKIRLAEHALKTTGLEMATRFQIKSLHPFLKTESLLASQVCSSGIGLSFDYTNWAMVRISI